MIKYFFSFKKNTIWGKRVYFNILFTQNLNLFTQTRLQGLRSFSCLSTTICICLLASCFRSKYILNNMAKMVVSSSHIILYHVIHYCEMHALPVIAAYKRQNNWSDHSVCTTIVCLGVSSCTAVYSCVHTSTVHQYKMYTVVQYISTWIYIYKVQCLCVCVSH